MGKYQDPDLVSASEIASYAFCPEAWRLGSTLCLRPNNERELSRDEHFHEKTAVLERVTQGALRLGLVLILLGALAIGIYRLVAGR
jgi:hypothetical protein